MRAQRFRYGSVEIDAAAGVLHCHYELDERPFEEHISFGPGHDWTAPALQESARLVALLAGASYYKAGAPPVIDLGELPIRDGERAFLREYYVDGLAEYAYRNQLDLGGIEIVGGQPAGAPTPLATSVDRPLIPFGGGLDSIVTVELLRERFPDSALFVLNRPGDPFAAIEDAAAPTGLPIVRATRQLDPTILRSAELGFLNGHVPITGILSAIAITSALLEGRGAVVMSNEWSASMGNVAVNGRTVNHQYSKSAAFETGFRGVLAGAIGSSVSYFSELRPFSELWIARQFAHLDAYHGVFHSCNRAFHQDRSRRQAAWCGQCDKCCFIDLILSPFLPAPALAAVFDGHEPLDNPSLVEQFRTLLDVSEQPKPWECVGDATECRAAAVLAAARPDRVDNQMLRSLADAAGEPDTASLLRPIGTHHIPDAFFPAAALG